MRIEAWAKHTHTHTQASLFLVLFFRFRLDMIRIELLAQGKIGDCLCAHLCCCYYYGVGGRSNAFDIGSRPLDGLGRVFAVHIIILLFVD